MAKVAGAGGGGNIFDKAAAKQGKLPVPKATPLRVTKETRQVAPNEPTPRRGNYPPVVTAHPTNFGKKAVGFVKDVGKNIEGNVVHPTRFLDSSLGLLGGSRKQIKSAYTHPIARLQNKGEFTPTEFVIVDGHKVPLSAGTLPWFGGPKAEFESAFTHDAAWGPHEPESPMEPGRGGPQNNADLIEHLLKNEGATPEQPFPLGGRKRGFGTEANPHPLLAGKPTIRKGVPPTANTLGESVIGSLKGTRGLRAEQEKLRSAERGKRSEAFGKELQANPTAAGARAASRQLVGEYPKVDFAGFTEFSPEAHDAMVKAVVDHPDLRAFEQKRTIDALEKVRNGVLPAKNEEKLLRKVFGPDTTKQLMTSASKFRQLKALGYDVANIPRSVMASYDASGILRQGLLIGTGHPVIFARNVPAYLKAIKSEDFYQAGMEGLHSRPNAVNGVYEAMGIDLTEMSPRGATSSREEPFRSPLAEKIFGVRQSGRGFVLYLDVARADLADYMYAKAIKQGRDVNDPHLLQSIGDVVNSSSGRGDLTTFAGKTSTGAIGRSQEGLNLLLFSPRLIKSRVDFINPFWYKGLDPLARHQAYRAMGGLVVLVTTALSIARAAGAQVNLDPRSSDFAKIKIGNTRLDLAGGFLQYIRLLSEIATQQVVTADGRTQNLGQEGPGKTSDWDVVFRFMRSKLAPLVSLSVDASQRQNTIGQPLTWQNTLLSRVTPLSGQDAFSVGQDATKSTGSVPAGVLAGLGAFGLSAIGGGVQNYTPRKPKSKKSSGNIFDSTPTPSKSSGGSSNIFDKP